MISSVGYDSFAYGPAFGSIAFGIGAWSLANRLYRLYKLSTPQKESLIVPDPDLKTNLQRTLVSLIVPARNEAARIRPLLDSIHKLSDKNFEALVVDDSSTDQTQQIARASQLDVISAGPKPFDWGGKNWACWIGAQKSFGDVLLFTDADVVLDPDSVPRLRGHLEKTQADLVSAVPYFNAQPAWERGLGFFYLLLFLVTGLGSRPQPRRLFAIGQFLAFRRKPYFERDGHKAVAGSLAEDVALAKKWVREGLRYEILPGPPAFRVQMFSTFGEFWKGWVRNFRLGISETPLSTVLEVFAVFSFLTLGGGQLIHTPWAWAAWGTLLLAIGFLMSRFGQFSAWFTILGVPLSALIYTAISAQALLSSTLKQPVYWRSRSYLLTPKKETQQ